MLKKNPQKADSEIKLETLKSIFDHNYQLIGLADNKATAILTVNGLMLTVVIALVGFLGDFFVFESYLDILAIVFFGLYLISCLVSLVFSILTISPLQRTGIPSPKHVFYYVNILEHKDKEKYHLALSEVLDDYNLIEEGFAEQIFSISVVNKRKYKFVRLCIWTLLSSFILVGAFLIILIFN